MLSQRTLVGTRMLETSSVQGSRPEARRYQRGPIEGCQYGRLAIPEHLIPNLVMWDDESDCFCASRQPIASLRPCLYRRWGFQLLFCRGVRRRAVTVSAWALARHRIVPMTVVCLPYPVDIYRSLTHGRSTSSVYVHNRLCWVLWLCTPQKKANW